MDNPFGSEFVNELYNIVGNNILTEDAILDLAKHYPERYMKGSYNDKFFLLVASEDYFEIVRYYMKFHNIPFTIESITSSFLWGVGNLRNEGIENTPPNIKVVITKMKKAMEPYALDLDSLAK